jgi:subtilisin family serine protease
MAPLVPPPPRTFERAKDRVLVKLASPERAAAAAVPPEHELLAKVRRVRGFRDARRQFPDAVAPRPGETIEGLRGTRMPKPDLTRWQRIEVAEGEDLDAVLADLRAIPGVEVAEPDYLRKPNVLPGPSSDPLYGQQWHLDAADIPAAWAHLESLGLPAGGARDIVVAVIDTGVDMTHPDLAPNLWTDSATGFHGRDVVANDNDPSDDHGHGTHVAGIIAGAANNAAGGVGVAYNVQIMPIKAAQYSGVLAASDIAEGITWAVQHGADIINMSFGGYGKSQIEEDALAVAFGSAVLVAAAGNDGLTNDPACDPIHWGVMYPAAYNWVLGVMASAPGGGRASFSNWDCIPRDTKEYEVLAPGAGIWSTLPGNQYAAWSGTSMATPVVSGIAALLRTKFADRTTFDSRFIMGQLAGTGTGAADALTALTSAPQPKLAYQEHWLFDSTTLSALNNGNGAVDAGETIDLAVVIRNHWGKADNVTVTLEPWAEGAVAPDPYVTMITPTVTYGAVGSFASDDNGLRLDTSGAVVGINFPFRFSVSTTTPNGHVIPFRATLTASNGYDSSDTAVYTTVSRFEISITNGREVPRIISQDTTLSADTLWLVRGPVLIEAGVTVQVEPGARIHFAFREAGNPYQPVELPFIQVDGALNVQGTPSAPVEMMTSPYETDGCREVYSTYPNCSSVRIKNNGTTHIQYAKITNPLLGVEQTNGSGFSGFLAPLTSVDHVYFDYRQIGSYQPWGIAAASLTKSVLHRLQPSAADMGRLRATRVDTTLFDSVSSRSYWSDTFVVTNAANSVFLDHLDISLGGLPVFTQTAFLNNYEQLDVSSWMKIRAHPVGPQCSGAATPIVLAGNYWGTTSASFIDAIVVDYFDDFSCPRIEYLPLLADPPAAAFPFVSGFALTAGGGQPATVVGAELVTFTASFNRPMDQGVQPQVSFGPTEPFTDHVVNGAWQDSTNWVGTYAVNGLTGDGYQYIRVAGARAASDPWLVTGDDKGRFKFEIVTSGSSAMNLQATGAEGRVDLAWTQNDFDLLAGFNLYRSTAVDGQYTRVNQSIVPPQARSFADTSVNPGQPYFYKFVVVKTDMTESQPSNVATATPLDTVPPVLSHTPRTSSPPGLAISLSATATDIVAVRGVALHFRPRGGTTYTAREMTNTSGSSYTATIEGSAVASPGVEYYLTATDGVSLAYAGRPEFPFRILVVDRPVLTSVSPGTGPTVGGTSVVVSGTNFKAGATVTFGGAVASNVHVVSSSQITCVSPPHVPVAVDVAVVNPDGQAGSLLRGFTYASAEASVSLPMIEAGQHSVVEVPINAAQLEGLLSADLSVTFDPAVIQAVSARTGSLTAGWSLATNANTPGTIHLSMASPGGGVTGAGVLAYLEFQVIGAPSTSSALTLATVHLNGGAVPAATASGALNVQAVCDVAGAITYWNTGAGVPGVDLALDGDRLYTAVTDTSGVFAVQDAPPGAYGLRASKTGGDDGITAFDASLVLQHAVHLTTLAGPAATAADVDKSGTIDALDASYILQRATNLIALPFPGAGVTWEFAPPTRTYANLTGDVSGQNFTAILLGDVSGNWAPAGMPQSAHAMRAATGDVELRLTELPASSSGTLTASVDLLPRATPVYSLDLVLRYDASRGTPTAVSLEPAAQGWMVTSNLATPGEIRVSLAGATAIAADTPLLAVSFTTTDGAQEVNLLAARAAANEALEAEVGYTLSLEHALLAAQLATGSTAPTAAELAKYDVAPVVAGERVPDGIVDVEDMVVILREAQGLAP